MKILKAIALTVSGFSIAATPFDNLGFDEPTRVPSGPIPFGSAEELIPSWGVSALVGYNFAAPFQGWASLVNADFRDTHFGQNARVPVVGNYSLGLWPPSGGGGPGGTISLAQTGDIPVDALSLRFLYHGNNLTVHVGGEVVPMHRLEDRPSGDPEIGDLHYFAVDVGPWAGKTVGLQLDFFTQGYDDFNGVPRFPGQPNASSHIFDDLSFSPLPAVPEPATWALLGVGLGAVLWRGRRR